MMIIKNLRVSGLVPIGMTARAGVFVSVGVAAILTALSGTALATPSSGVSATVVARASFADPTDVMFKIKGEDHTEVLRAPDLQETVMQNIIITPGGTTGWHSHPGPVVVLVKAGALTFYSSEDPACTPRTYSVGQAFVDPGQGHVHNAFNLGGQNLELWVTYFDVPPGGAVRLDAPNPGNCGF